VSVEDVDTLPLTRILTGEKDGAEIISVSSTNHRELRK
jgi:hypothetical protein